MKALKTNPDIEFELATMCRDVHFKEVFELNVRIHYIIRSAKKDLSSFKKFYDLCKEVKPDIVHCWDSMTAVYAAPVCKLLHITLVNGMVIDSPSQQNIFNKHWLRARLTFPFSRVIVGNSKAGLKAYKSPLTKCICIPNGFNFKRTSDLIPSSAIRDQLDADGKILIGMVASFATNKDYPTFFKSAQQLLNKRKDIVFIAIGNNTDSEESRNLISEDNMKYFRLLGKRSGIESFVNAFDICVLATFTEGISNSILEYMALGKPVIATSGGGTDEIVDDNITGFLVQPQNPEELEIKMELLANDVQMRERMGKNGTERILEYFTIDAMIRSYITLYENLLTGKK